MHTLENKKASEQRKDLDLRTAIDNIRAIALDQNPPDQTFVYEIILLNLIGVSQAEVGAIVAVHSTSGTKPSPGLLTTKAIIRQDSHSSNGNYLLSADSKIHSPNQYWRDYLADAKPKIETVTDPAIEQILAPTPYQPRQMLIYPVFSQEKVSYLITLFSAKAIFSKAKMNRIHPLFATLSGVLGGRTTKDHPLTISRLRADRTTAEQSVEQQTTNTANTFIQAPWSDHHRHQIKFDPVFELFNYALLETKLKDALELRSEQRPGITLFSVEIDRFKAIINTLGQVTSDTLIHWVAQRIQSCIPPEDRPIRVSADEFMIIHIPGHETPHPTLMGSQLIESLRQPFVIHGQEIIISTSIGIASAEHQETLAKALIRKADIAKCSAKAQGKNRYDSYTDALDIRSKANTLLYADLHRALEKNEFEVHYQPQVCLNTNQIKGFEALLRWKHPILGDIPRDQFIPKLEETGLIDKVGHWVIETALLDMAAWLSSFSFLNETKMSVNLSTRQLRDLQIVDHIQASLTKAELNPANMIVEVTESVFLENLEENKNIFNQIRSLGVAISLDDFGVGYSSLAYLKKFPLDHLKIDRCFVTDITENPVNAAIVQAMVGLANALDLGVIAEGVEKGLTLDHLSRMGCSIYQGFFYAKPLTPEDLLVLLKGIDFTNLSKPQPEEDPVFPKQNTPAKFT